VGEDLEAVLRKIEGWHQGSISGFLISYWDTDGVLHQISWNGRQAAIGNSLMCRQNQQNAGPGSPPVPAPWCRHGSSLLAFAGRDRVIPAQGLAAARAESEGTRLRLRPFA
jgi:hypothetical protein